MKRNEQSLIDRRIICYAYRDTRYHYSVEVEDDKVASITFRFAHGMPGEGELLLVKTRVEQDWIGRPYSEWVAALGVEVHLQFDGVLFRGTGYFIQRDGKPSEYLGPFETRGQAHFMAKATAWAKKYKTVIPRPQSRYAHQNGIEYTVLAISNEHSDRPEYLPKVVYQGDNGRVWDKPVEDFMKKMKLIANSTPIHTVTDAGPVQLLFTDAEGKVCNVVECGLEDRLTLEIEVEYRDMATGASVKPTLALSKEHAHHLAGYLSYFSKYGRFPDQSLSKDNAA